MGKSILSLNRIEILNQKSDTEHSDNDWLCMVWSINDQVYSKTVPLLNVTGSQVLHSGDVLRPFQDYVVCKNTDTVIVNYSVINLSSYDWGKQAEAAAQFTQKVADIVAPIYLEAAVVVLGIVASGGLAAPAIIQQIAGGSAPLLDKLSGVAGGLIDKAYDEAITPALKWVVEFFAELLGGQPNCNGEVFHDYVIFLPNQPHEDLHISHTYDGPQTNSSCGNAPHTKVDITLRRELDVELQADWYLCQKCNVMFFNGHDTKGVCPGNQGAHEAMGFNFVLPHDTPGPGQTGWRFCHKCNAMFYDEYPSKGICPAGSGHEASVFGVTLPYMHPLNFVLPYIEPGQEATTQMIIKATHLHKQINWRFCVKCQAMFFDGSPSKGTCPAGGGHQAEGYNFILGYQ